jgi:hypothetical protein
MKTPFLLVLAALFSVLAPPVSAMPESLPVEVALLYQKLINEMPSYDRYIYSNKDIILPDNETARSEVLEKHRDDLRLFYEKASRDTLIVSHSPLKLSDVDLAKKRFAFDMNPDEPLIFRPSEGESYGVFIRNALETIFLVPPYIAYQEIAAAENLTTPGTEVSVELILKPLGADRKPIRLNKELIRPILADAVSLKVFDASGKTILEKRFGGWLPEEADETGETPSPARSPLFPPRF